MIAAALVGLLLIGVLVGWAATRDDGDPTTAGPSSTTEASTTAPPTTASTTTEAPTTTTPPTTDAPTTTAPPPTDAPSTTAAPAPSGPQALERAALDYYATIGAGDVEGGWALLSPGFQEETGGFAAYREFWTEDVASVEVQGRPRADADEGTVSLRLRYGLPDGGTSTEQVLLTFVEAEDGRLLVDGYRTGASRDDEDD